MKRFLRSSSLLLLALIVFQPAYSQCVVDYFSLQKKVYISDLIVEGKITHKTSYWDADKHNIYTLNRVEVYTALNGIITSQEIEIVTDGGTVGFERHQASPSLELEIGDEGVFLLVENKIQFEDLVMRNGHEKYRPAASIQSFIKYDRENDLAHGYHEDYTGIESLLLSKIKEYTKEAPIKIQNNGYKKGVRPTAPPAISSFSMDTITAGTRTILTINGSNFGIVRGKGTVGFRDANFGDGRYYTTPYATSYKSWSNTKIEVYVPSRAGTGRVKVTSNFNESGTSTSDVYIPYSHLNAVYVNKAAGIDTSFFMIDQVNDNTKGGYTWQMTTNFAGKKQAVNAFMRSLENWRCGTLMNWDVGSNTTTDATAKDNINIVRFTKFGDSRLGVCWSRWGGCSSGQTLVWYLNELDIEFDSTRNWYYGDGTTPNSQFDFESVSTHELGHGHQLGHVVDKTKIMHYSIGKGDRKTTLHNDDIDAGSYVRDKSKVSNVCGPGKIVPIKLSDCNITKPKTKFTANRNSACPGDFFIVTDATEGIVTSYAWTFDTGGSITSANTKGPFAVKYSTAGNKTIQLITGNDFGTDTFQLVVRVDSAAPDAVDSIGLADVTCIGELRYDIMRPARAESYSWSLSGGGTVNGVSDADTILIDWNQTGGPFTLTVKASNICGESANYSEKTTVKENVVAGFTTTENGLEVTFSNTSTAANSFKWHFGDGDSSSDQNPFYTYKTRGKFKALLTASNECSEDTISKWMDVTWGAGINTLENKRVLTIQPHPIQDQALIGYDFASIPEATFTIIDLNGKLVKSVNLRSGKFVNLERNNLAAGTYLFELRAEGMLIESGKVLFK